MNEKYKILETYITHTENLIIVFECKSDETDAFTRSIEVPINISIEETINRVNNAAHNAILDYIEVDEQKKERDDDRKHKESSREALKVLIDKEIGKQKLVNKPKKKEKK